MPEAHNEYGLRSKVDREMNPSLSILMVNYNTCDMTLACLSSIYAQTKQTSFEIIMVDNASADGSVEAIRNAYPDVKLLPQVENLGFARGTNLAAMHAAGDFLLLLNTDTIVLDFAIDRLMDFQSKSTSAGIWGGRTLFADGRLNPTSCWRKMTPWSLFCLTTGLRRMFQNTEFFNSEGYGGWKRDTVRHVDIVTGCFFLTTANLWRKLGGFDEQFFMYGEEVDLCLRSSSLGVRPLVTPDATIIHYGGGSTNDNGVKLVYQMRAKIELMKRHWERAFMPVGKTMLLANALLRMAAAGAASVLSKGSASNSRYRVWRHVWDERGSWLKGYVDAKSDSHLMLADN